MYEQDEDTNVFKEVNKRTTGHEFYGAAGVYAFLYRLRSQARSYYRRAQQRSPEYPVQPSPQQEDLLAGAAATSKSAEDVSVVNYLHDDTGNVFNIPPPQRGSSSRAPILQKRLRASSG